MKRIALIGMPNTGKSTFFNRMSGASARVGNWPGITVDLMSAKVLLGGHIVELVDLPGIYDLHGYSEDEQVVRHFITNNEIDLVIIVLNSTQIDRQLPLTLQLQQLEMPALLTLNMVDEANKSGVSINTESLGKALAIPTISMSAKYGDGMQRVKEKAATLINENAAPSNPQAVLQALKSEQQVEQKVDDLIANHVSIPATLSESKTDKIDNILLHPWLGLPIFFAAMFILFQLIFTVGAPFQDGLAWLLDTIRTTALDPLFANAPSWLSGLMLDGIYNGIATVAAFIPIIILFFLVMAMVEDSGYLSRAAFLIHFPYVLRAYRCLSL